MADGDNNTDINALIQQMDTAAGGNDVEKANALLAQLAAAPPPAQATPQLAPPQDRSSVVKKMQADIQAAQAAPTPQPSLSVPGASQQLPNALTAAPTGLAAAPLVQGGIPAGQTPVPHPMVGGLPGLIWDLLSPSHRALGTPQGAMVPSKLDKFESFLSSFLTSLSAGLSQEGRGPGSAQRGFAAAMQSPYQQSLQQYQLGQQAQAQQAQIEDIQSQADLRRAQVQQMGQSVSFRDPVTGQMLTMPYAVAVKAFPQVFSAEARKYQADVGAQTKLTIADMQAQIAAGKIAHVYPVRDANGNLTGMQGYNQQGQPVGVLPGAVPPASLFGNTKFVANSDGSYSSTTTRPNIPGAPGGKTKPGAGGGAPAAGGGVSSTSPAGAGLPPQVQASRIAAMEKSTDPITNQAVRLVNSLTTIDQLEGKTKQQVLQRADQYSQLKNGAPFNAVTGGAVDPFGVKLGVTSTGQVLQRNEFTQAQKTFAKDYIEPLNVLKKTTQEFQRIDQDPNQTGAEKVTALLNAVGISGDPLKGKGFRINQAIIQEHADARNIWESGIQKLNKVFGSGGPITSKQIADYRAVAEGVVHDAYLSAAQEARRQGLAVDFLPRATAANQVVDPLTAKIYLDVANGDVNAAHRALLTAGYK